jgi:hypothetical protein
VLKELTDLRLMCQHGETYEDPITKKSREFDIRALMYGAESVYIHLSLECKNIRNNCVFRLIVGTNSGASWAVIPVHRGQL